MKCLMRLSSYIKNKTQNEEFGLKGRKYIMAHYSRDEILKTIENSIKKDSFRSFVKW